MSTIMQGTIARFEPETDSGASDLIGSALLDDGRQVDFDTAAFVASGLRLVRPGQRINLEIDASGHVTRIDIPTM